MCSPVWVFVLLFGCKIREKALLRLRALFGFIHLKYTNLCKKQGENREVYILF